MGAISVVRTVKARDIKEAWKIACEQEREENGTDPYNGSMHHCELTKDVTSKKPTMLEEELVQYMIDNSDKREVMGFCKEQPKANENKIKTVVENFPQKGTRKWKTVYQAVNSWTDEVCVTAEKQTECITKARAYIEKHPDVTLTIRIVKELTEGNSQCAKIKYKPASNERLGTYVFAGMAPY